MKTLNKYSLIAAVGLVIFAALPGLASGQEPVVKRTMGSWDEEVMKKFKKKRLEKAMYKKIFGHPMPRGYIMRAVNFKGKLKLEKLNYLLPTTPFNWDPTLGDEQDILNCGNGTIVSKVSLVVETQDKIIHSFEKNIAAKITTEASVEAEVGVDIKLAGKALTRVGVKITGEVSASRTWTEGHEKITKRTFTQEKTVTTAPNTLTRTQLIYQKFDVPGIPFEAKFYAQGRMDVLFVKKAIGPVNSKINFSGDKDYCMRAAGQGAAIWNCGNDPRLHWTYTKKMELRNGLGSCLDVIGGSKWVNRNRNQHRNTIRRRIRFNPLGLNKGRTRKCNGGLSQRWKLSGGEFKGGKYSNGTFSNGNLCLGTPLTKKWVRKFMAIGAYACDGSTSQKWGGWSGGNRAGPVNIEEHLQTQKDRLFVITGNLNGTLHNNRSYFSVEDTTLTSKQCKELRSGQGMQVASARSIQTKSKTDKKSVFVKRYRGKSLKGRKLNLRNIKFK